jgi:hypothetical protein
MHIPKPVIPGEHGAWAVLLVPMITAVSSAGIVSTSLLLLALSALGVFMSYVPVHTVLRDTFVTRQAAEKLYQAKVWAGLYLLAGAAFMIPLLARGFWLLLLAGLPGAVFFFSSFFLTQRYSKTIPGDLMAVAGLTIGAPCAYYVLTHSLDRAAFVLWLLNFLFFGCSIVYVHMKIRAASSRKPWLTVPEKLAIGKSNVAYHFAVMALVLGLTVAHFVPQLTFLAFVPMTAHASYGTCRLSRHVRFKNLGFLLLGHSILFVLILRAARY